MAIKTTRRITNYQLLESMPVDVWFGAEDCMIDGEMAFKNKNHFRKRVRAIDKLIPLKSIKVDSTTKTEFRISEKHKQALMDIHSESQVQQIYHLIDPNGRKLTVQNMSKFCRERGFNPGGFYGLVNGNIPSGKHKGWSLDKSSAKERNKAKLSLNSSKYSKEFELMQLFINA